MKKIQKLLRSKKPVKWLFYGDSITHGAFHTMGWRDYTELFSERVRYELYRAGDIVIKTAYNGDTTRHLLKNFDWRVKQFQPHVVFIMIGMNDCCTGKDGPRIPLEEFRANLTTLVKRIRAIKGALPVFQTANLILNGAVERAPYLGKYMAALRGVARENQVPLIDHTAYWKEQTKTQPNRLHYWMNDSCHPNEMGHRVFAHLIFKKFGILDHKSSSCRFFYP